MKGLLIVFSLLFYCTNACFAEENAVKISEIMINPEGKDENKEWVELYNTSNKSLELENWQIVINDKTTALNRKIQAKGHILVKPEGSIKNTEGVIQLLDSQNTIVDQINYSKTKEGNSYSHIIVVNSDKRKTVWKETQPTPLSPNSIIYEISGLVSKNPVIKNEYYFEINNKQKITFSKQDFNFKEISQTLQENDYIEIHANKTPSGYELIDYRVITKAPKRKSKKESDLSAALLLIPISSLLLLKIRSI